MSAAPAVPPPSTRHAPIRRAPARCTPTLAPRRLLPQLTVYPVAIACRPAALGDADDSDERTLAGLHTAVARGVTLLDTADADGDGHCERLLGRLLENADRAALRISSKVGRVRGTAVHPYAGPRVRQQFEQTVENLGTDYLDLYSLHSLDFGPDDVHLPAVIDQMQALRDAGYIKAIGMPGPSTPAGGSPAAADRRFEWIFQMVRPDVLWIPYNPLTPTPHVGDEDVFAFTARHGTAVLITEPLAHGLLTGKYTPAQPPTRTAHTLLRSPWFSAPGLAVIAEGLAPLRRRFGSAPAALARLALHYCLARGDHVAAAVGFSEPEQLTGTLDAVEHGRLTADDAAFVANAYHELREILAQLSR